MRIHKTIMYTPVLFVGLSCWVLRPMPVHADGQVEGVIQSWVPRELSAIQKQLPTDFYTIHWGDTLDLICTAAKIPMDIVIHWNQIVNQDLILAGEILVLTDPATIDPDNRERYASSNGPAESTTLAPKSSAINRFEKRQ
ncbi:hypothetical protein A5886_000741 [Enterococcus sp. 8G7_MSG3316]|uniref:LysM domain-containing protein n=1 Tax=Candidatus Enterococcus testudinis TaxID=1834191 RepID=A0A242A3Q7_9ENTE|nr:LysM domain-containing protein [Enterococcus sp. 8G7_MSG3316]OTN75666.1 hypothetical protein A5886_000741 [Enterococcus sp. 8G7_MSG3316]